MPETGPKAPGLICSRLSAGDGPAILVADFQALNATPRLSRLITDAAPGRRVYQLDPRAAVAGDRRYATLPELVAEAVALFHTAESATAAERRVFVVSHCSAAGLSLRIAGRLSDTHEVSAVLVQPTWPGNEHIAERWAEFQAKLGLGDQPCPDLDGDPQACVVQLERLMQGGLAGLAERLGLATPPLAFAELLVSYRTWLAFLLACRNDGPATAPAEGVAVTVLTDEPGFVLPGAGRCRITPPPPADRPDDVTPELARLVLEHCRK